MNIFIRATQSLHFRITHALKRRSPPASLPYLYIAPPDTEPLADDFASYQVTLFVCLGQREERVGDLLRRCRELTIADACFRPIIATDIDSPLLFCTSGLFIERIVSAEEWSSFSSADSWESYFNSRRKEFKQYYRPVRTIFISGDEDVNMISGASAASQ